MLFVNSDSILVKIYFPKKFEKFQTFAVDPGQFPIHMLILRERASHFIIDNREQKISA